MKKNNKGFTLMEMLIVVAIIAILVAIAIPVFTAQLEKARETTDLANIRSAYAKVLANYLTDNTTEAETVKVVQTVAGFDKVENPVCGEYDLSSFTSIKVGTDVTVQVVEDADTGDASVEIKCGGVTAALK